MERIKDLAFLVIGLAIVSVWWIHEDGASQSQARADMQCEMFELYQKTNGELGWPNYEGIDCDK